LPDGLKSLFTKLLLFDPPRLFKPEVAGRVPGYSPVSNSYRMPERVGLRATFVENNELTFVEQSWF
jgi:hypothetical protein